MGEGGGGLLRRWWVNLLRDANSASARIPGLSLAPPIGFDELWPPRE